jgi:Xaa-Pro aminopeptidase
MISPQEYQTRIEKLQKLAADSGLDVFIVSEEESILYLSGIPFVPLERPFFILVYPDRDPDLLVPMLERDYLSQANFKHTINTYWDYPAPPEDSWMEQLRHHIQDCKSVGIEISAPVKIQQAIQDFTPTPFDFIEQLRLVKSPDEIKMIRYAAKYADQAVENVISAAYYGVSMLELFRQGGSVQLNMLKEIGFNAFTSSVLAGAWPAPGSAMPHAIPNLAARHREGPHIAGGLIRAHGYTAESERTFFLSPPSETLKQAFADMREARRRAFELARPGASCAEIDEAANGYLRDQGYAENLRHRTGHGFGLSTHEGPYVSAGSTEILEPGMLISIEPGIYLPEIGGVRHSDTVLITESGYESLTVYPRDLESMTVRGYKPIKRLTGAITRQVANLGKTDK